MDPNAGDAGDSAVEDLAHLLARHASLRRAAAWDAAIALPDLHVAAALVQQRQPADPPAPDAVEQGALDALLAWARGRGAWLTPSVRVVAGARGARVEAIAPIAAGEPLVEVPVGAMVRGRDVLARGDALAAWLGGEPLFGPGTLMLWLMVARYGGGTPEPWAAYLDALPGRVPGTALAWPRSPGAHLGAARHGQRFLAGVLQLYCVVRRRLADTAPAARPLPLEAFTLQRWLWAGAILSTRQTAIDGELALVPVWDLLDHDESLGAETTELVDGRLRCAGGAAYAPGAPVGAFHGRRTPAERWAHNGFVPPGPPDGERAAVPFPLPADAPLRRDKLVWLLAQRDAPVEVEVGRGALDAAVARARWYALDGDALDRLGCASVADAWGVELRLSEPGEARAQALVRRWLDELAGPATPVDPFSVDHARMLAAAHARYAGLVPGAGGARVLDDADAAAIDAWLAPRVATAWVLRHNLHATGLTYTGLRHSGTWVGRFDGDAVVGVATHARTGHVVVQAQADAADDAAALALEVVARSGREVTGLVGPGAAVDAARAALGLAARAAAHERRELACAVELARLRVPEALARGEVVVRAAGAADVDAVVALRGEGAREAIARQVGEGAVFVAEVDGQVRATASLDRVADAVQVHGVVTAAAHRRRGLAACCVAGALEASRVRGATRAVLYVDPANAAARGAYTRLGFAGAGEHVIVVLASGAA